LLSQDKKENNTNPEINNVLILLKFFMVVKFGETLIYNCKVCLRGLISE
jgi:hypothetical protein